jgi:metal-sulfur cluster biosynthetic enzyme
MLTEADIWAALNEVIHPSFGMSLVTLQMVLAIRISPERIEVDLVMSCPGCLAGQAALARTRQVLHSLVSPGNGQVVIRLLPQAWHPPWESLTGFR